MFDGGCGSAPVRRFVFEGFAQSHGHVFSIRSRIVLEPEPDDFGCDSMATFQYTALHRLDEASNAICILVRVSNVGRNKLAQFRQPRGKRTVARPELRKLVPAYGPWHLGRGQFCHFNHRC